MFQIASGRRKLGIPVVHPLTGVAAASASLLRGWKRFISAVVKVKKQSGTQCFKKHAATFALAAFVTLLVIYLIYAKGRS